MIHYRLGGAAATRRARALAAVGALASLAPVGLAAVLLDRLGRLSEAGGSGLFAALAVSLAGLVAVRAGVGYRASSRRLSALVIDVDEDRIDARAGRDACSIERVRVARIVEIAGSLGGLRVESEPDPRTGLVSVVRVPRGGDAFGEVRAILEGWRPIDRSGRRGPAARVALGALVVAAIFFLPFLLDDFVARSKVLAAGLVIAMWLVVRKVLRRG